MLLESNKKYKKQMNKTCDGGHTAQHGRNIYTISQVGMSAGSYLFKLLKERICLSRQLFLQILA
jgi:hypothetical protein